jgi:hypothetical protein
MGKNKKNKNRNVFDINDDINDVNNDNDTNDTNIDDDFTPQQNKKKIMSFALLDNDEDTEEQPKSEPKSEQPNNITKQTKQDVFKIAYEYDLSGNFEEAIKFYKIADNLGSKSALGNLAILLDENNLPEADFYYKKAIQSGNIGSLYDYAEYLAERENKKSLEYFQLYMNLKNANLDEKILWKNIISRIIL